MGQSALGSGQNRLFIKLWKEAKNIAAGMDSSDRSNPATNLAPLVSRDVTHQALEEHASAAEVLAFSLQVYP